MITQHVGRYLYALFSLKYFINFILSTFGESVIRRFPSNNKLTMSPFAEKCPLFGGVSVGTTSATLLNIGDDRPRGVTYFFKTAPKLFNKILYYAKCLSFIFVKRLETI
uniref:Uncharacterized protein n=1 Tax=Cacopsylla melanoneura TaxID=428564 RepID=A0A8D8RP86_9HEMI